MEKLRNLRIYMVSLGCAKNRVDSEKTLARLVGQGCVIVGDPSEAEYILINSCGFLGEAREETVDTILELAEQKKQNPSLKLAVMGCMVELFKGEMQAELPEVDYLVGLSDGEVSEIYDSANTDRLIEPGAVSAYLKIAEGCGNSCSFCSIPLIRGPLKSRPVDDVIVEASRLVKNGIKEICIVSQDSTRYGLDLGIKGGLVKLLKKVVEVDPKWVRLHYLYPTLITDELIELVASEPKLCAYMDVPFQHIDSGVLKKMGRQESEDDIKRLIEKIRRAMPEAAIRSAFITGFPGEGEKEFQKLERFLSENELDHVGVFTYSPEKGTRGFDMEETCSGDEKEERKARLMEIQKSVSLKKNKGKVGKILPVLVERFDAGNNLLVGRLETQAPEVDGEVILSECVAEPGEIIKVKIVESMEYDLVGEEV